VRSLAVHVAMLLEMAADGFADRAAIGPVAGGMTFPDLAVGARRVGAFLGNRDGERVVLVDLNSEAVPLTLFGAAIAGKPYVPLNYRLADDQLRAIVTRTAPALIVAGEGVAERLGAIDGIEIASRKEVLDVASDE